jgi:hypothetical protein
VQRQANYIVFVKDTTMQIQYFSAIAFAPSFPYNNVLSPAAVSAGKPYSG